MRAVPRVSAAAEGFHDDADEILGNVNDKTLNGLQFLAIFGAHNDFRLANHEFETLAAHGFDKDGKLQFAAAENAEGLRRIGVLDANGDVGQELLGEAVAEIARSKVAAFASGERSGIDGEDHGEGGLINGEGLELRGIFATGDGFANLDALNASNGDDIAGGHGFRLIALKTAESE